jgi:hypothetical protein
MMSEGMAMVLRGLVPDNVINPEAFPTLPQGTKQ